MFNKSSIFVFSFSIIFSGKERVIITATADLMEGKGLKRARESKVFMKCQLFHRQKKPVFTAWKRRKEVDISYWKRKRLSFSTQRYKCFLRIQGRLSKLYNQSVCVVAESTECTKNVQFGANLTLCEFNGSNFSLLLTRCLWVLEAITMSFWRHFSSDKFFALHGFICKGNRLSFCWAGFLSP